MTIRCRFGTEAEIDTGLIIAWYERQMPGLGRRFATDLSRTIDRVSRFPDIYASVYRSVRRARIGRFPYFVAYELFAGELVILGVFGNPPDRSDFLHTVMWPGVLELSTDFYDILESHAVPLDYRALSALKHSALALDIYTWLAHRLCRVNKPGGVMLSWANLRDQFGQEYGSPKDFKKEFRSVMRQTLTVYPEAHVAEIDGGVQLYPSRPPLARTQISLSVPASVDKPADN